MTRSVWIFANLLIVALGLSVQASQAAELVMVRRSGCPYCQTWDRMIGPVYSKSDIGRQFPIRMVDLDRDPPLEAKLDRAVYFTPTFILVEEGREVGRIEGYPGEDFFWGLLEKLGRSLPSRS
ncbi:thioredoxin family protein [Microvirga rosea]|uniref:thioredoxin family protein n=1 Tax=Microvirga rosea TaxID=2715425 RepID=UPI001D0BBD05|nr:thioredoxin family protein [Microvirga rosea]MCB8823502.1 thioredoxin family protein [Microvirga rosea]